MARKLGISRKLLHDWIKAWKAHGPEGLNRKRGPMDSTARADVGRSVTRARSTRRKLGRAGQPADAGEQHIGRCVPLIAGVRVRHLGIDRLRLRVEDIEHGPLPALGLLLDPDQGGPDISDLTGERIGAGDAGLVAPERGARGRGHAVPCIDGFVAALACERARLSNPGDRSRLEQGNPYPHLDGVFVQPVDRGGIGVVAVSGDHEVDNGGELAERPRGGMAGRDRGEISLADFRIGQFRETDRLARRPRQQRDRNRRGCHLVGFRAHQPLVLRDSKPRDRR